MADMRPMDAKEQYQRDLNVMSAHVGVVDEQRRSLETKLAHERAQHGDLIRERDELERRWLNSARKNNDFVNLVYDAETTLRRLHRLHTKPETCKICKLISRLNHGRTSP